MDVAKKAEEQLIHLTNEYNALNYKLECGKKRVDTCLDVLTKLENSKEITRDIDLFLDHRNSINDIQNKIKVRYKEISTNLTNAL